MYALASLGAPFLLRSRRKIIYTAKDLMYVLMSCGASVLLRNRYGTMSVAKGSDLYPGVP